MQGSKAGVQDSGSAALGESQGLDLDSSGHVGPMGASGIVYCKHFALGSSLSN